MILGGFAVFLLVVSALARADATADSPAPAGAEGAVAQVPAAEPEPAAPAGSPPAAPAAEPPARPPPTPCTLEDSEEFFGLDWIRRATYRSVCTPAYWLDRRFGEDELNPREEQVSGHLGLDFERRKNGKLEFSPKIRLRVNLPNLSRKLQLVFDRDDEKKTIDGQAENALSRVDPFGSQDTAQVGLAYEIMRGVDSLLNFRLGLRLTKGQPDPYVRSRYARAFAKTDTSEWRFGETLFWKESEGFGETTSLDYKGRLGETSSLHFNNSATLSQSTDYLKWDSTVSIVDPFDERRTMVYSYSASGETGKPERVAIFGPRISFRRQMNRPWMFGEVFVGIDRQKAQPEVPRVTSPYVGARLEAHFGKR